MQISCKECQSNWIRIYIPEDIYDWKIFMKCLYCGNKFSSDNNLEFTNNVWVEDEE